MFPLWEVAIAPVLEAAGARRIVEIGALRGENTRQMIERLGPGTELHVIDPLPDFDPEEHEQEFAGQYVFHRDLSLNVLGDLPAMDAALVDGDHNWYTVYNECRLLAESARRDGAPLPVMIFHDVGWPYGRRDLYYDPSNIPEEHRRDWARKGMEPGTVRLVPYGAGLNPTLANARVEGGHRNGVMTGVEDWMAEHPEPLRRVVLPIYFGLAIVVEESRLARQPDLAAELDRLESPAGKDQLLELAESIRIDALLFQHRIFFDREQGTARLATRYLDQVRRSLRAGPDGSGPLTALQDSLELLRSEYVRGDLAFVSADPTPAGVLGQAHAIAHLIGDRSLWLLATASGIEPATVHHRLEQLDLPVDRVHVVDGPSNADTVGDRLALVHIGADACTTPDIDAVLAAWLPRLADGGIIEVAGPGADTAATDRVATLVGAHPGLAPDPDAPLRWRRTGRPD
jgi:hypothetical protein